MTQEEMYSGLTDAGKAQWDKPVLDFIKDVKCCHNCSHWQRDYSLMNDYAWNCCDKITPSIVDMTAWDNCCDDYNGTAIEDNLLAKEGKLMPEDTENDKRSK